ncbi:MAG: hypothetical protein GY804_02105 [Alphaproteobacteria bacterium]|nr:hypothetical protein [Alphaproteobacteria bacterium]
MNKNTHETLTNQSPETEGKEPKGSLFSKFKNNSGFKNGLKASQDLLIELGTKGLEMGLTAAGLIFLSFPIELGVASIAGLVKLAEIKRNQAKIKHKKKAALKDLTETLFDAPEDKSEKDIMESVHDKTAAFIIAGTLDPKNEKVTEILTTLEKSKHREGVVANGITFAKLKEVINPKRAREELAQEQAAKAKVPVQLNLFDYIERQKRTKQL